jgi:hypothetical protein
MAISALSNGNLDMKANGSSKSDPEGMLPKSVFRLGIATTAKPDDGDNLRPVDMRIASSRSGQKG